MNMDCEYFKDHIKEELDGAKAYAKAALELRAMNPSWAKMFLDMCAQELIHAKNFYEMFNEYYDRAIKPYSETPKYFREVKTEIVDLYTECYSKVKVMQEMAGK